MRKRAGIYSIQHLESGKRYIGSSVNLDRRFQAHKTALRKGEHCNKILQNAWNKYGEDSFQFSVLDYCEDVNELITMEQQWVDSLKPRYNIRKIAKSNLGIRWSKEVRAKMSVAQKKTGKKPPGMRGRKHTEHTKLKMSVAQRGKIVSQETKDKLAAINRGKKLSETAKLKISKSSKGNSYALGTRHSEETKKKMSESRRGRRAWNKGIKMGYTHTEESLEKMREARKKAMASAGARKIISDARKAYWAERKKLLTHCPKGHEYTEDNTYISPCTGTKCCRICRRNRDKIRRMKKREREEITLHDLQSIRQAS